MHSSFMLERKEKHKKTKEGREVRGVACRALPYESGKATDSMRLFHYFVAAGAAAAAAVAGGTLAEGLWCGEAMRRRIGEVSGWQ